MVRAWLKSFIQEQLDADQDISISAVIIKDDYLTVTGQPGGVRLFFSALFILPGLWLLWQAAAHMAPVLLVLSVICCPVLFAIGLLLGYVTTEKTFNMTKMTATRSIRFFTLSTSVSERLPRHGSVVLSSEWEAGGESRGCWWHKVRLDPCCAGIVFTAASNYTRVSSFVEQLSKFLHYKSIDLSEPRSRDKNYFPN